MAVGKLSGAWIRQVLTEVYPEGVLRRALLDHFAVLLVSKRSSRGAKGRLARRLYGRLLSLQRRGLIVQEGGMVRSLAAARKPEAASPELGPVLERLLFKALMAEDGQGDGHTPAGLREAHWDFISRALEAGWTLEQASLALGVKIHDAAQILEER
jgi:hypothetical protein